ncbi:MAG: DUF4279 domain-containing protein [Cyanobacteria bacterium SZAS LIN-2]|nr:DUF4279 domain-containing protein [Cyanobacteria bacterium SZAS LIN-2]MBS2008085.1 DUF4279 domain-containing protein [Cyanobacteria bacterium SZAS TMP-1]
MPEKGYMKTKSGTTRTNFISVNCLFSEEPAPIQALVDWSSGGFVFNEALKNTCSLLVSSARSKSLEQHFSTIQEQWRIDRIEAQKYLNVIVRASATCPNTKFTISHRELNFLSRHDGALLLEIWESSELIASGPDLTMDREELRFSDPYLVYAKLRIAGQHLEPEDVTSALKLEPSWSWAPGDIDPWNEPYTFGAWSLSTENAKKIDATSLEQHCVYLLDLLYGQRSNLRRLREQGFLCQFVIFWEANYYVTKTILSSDVVAKLASFGIDIICDVYF